MRHCVQKMPTYVIRELSPEEESAKKLEEFWELQANAFPNVAIKVKQWAARSAQRLRGRKGSPKKSSKDQNTLQPEQPIEGTVQVIHRGLDKDRDGVISVDDLEQTLPVDLQKPLLEALPL